MIAQQYPLFLFGHDSYGASYHKHRHHGGQHLFNICRLASRKLQQYATGLKSWKAPLSSGRRKLLHLKRNGARENSQLQIFDALGVANGCIYKHICDLSMLLMLIILAFMLGTLSFDDYNKSSLFKSQNSVVQYIIVKT